MDIIKNSAQTLQQLNDVVESLSADELIQPLDVLNGSSLGQHIRHIIEFYVELINGHKSGVVCYDNRERNVDFESSHVIIISKLNHIISTLKDCDLNKNLKIESNHCTGNNNENTLSNSSVLREVVYALDHTVHHLAIIKIAMQAEMSHIKINQNMGVAPSTIRNNNTVCAQ